LDRQKVEHEKKGQEAREQEKKMNTVSAGEFKKIYDPSVGETSR